MLSGNGTTMSSLLFHSRLPDCPYEIVLVASNQPDARGLRIAEAEGIATFAHSHRGMERVAHETVMDTALREAGAEFIALCGYMRVLTESFVDRWAGRMLNTHPSLLPKYKGLHTHQPSNRGARPARRVLGPRRHRRARRRSGCSARCRCTSCPTIRPTRSRRGC
jgi:phosphoribosylglycinamide formyltransferase-1